MGQVPLAAKESYERPPRAGHRIAHGAPQCWVPQFDGVEHGTLGGYGVQRYFAVAARELAQMRGQHHPDHDRVCTSTESTAGRSRTMGAQLSPEFADTYTCPPVVPKYTPHSGSESTAIASRNTLT